MRKIITMAAAGAMAAGALLAASPTAAAAPDEAAMYCLLEHGVAPKCASTEAGMRAMSTTAASHVVTLFNGINFTGAYARFYRGEGDCTAESDFSPPDDDWYIPYLNGTRRWASSVNKIDGGHCNWRLVGPNGGKSTEVEGDWRDLSNLGNNWNNRAVRIQVD